LQKVKTTRLLPSLVAISSIQDGVHLAVIVDSVTAAYHQPRFVHMEKMLGEITNQRIQRLQYAVNRMMVNRRHRRKVRDVNRVGFSSVVGVTLEKDVDRLTLQLVAEDKM